MDEIETSIQRSGGNEAERRQDGGGRPEALPGSEAARGNDGPKAEVPEGAALKRTAPGGVEVEEQSGTSFAETSGKA